MGRDLDEEGTTTCVWGLGRGALQAEGTTRGVCLESMRPNKEACGAGAPRARETWLEMRSEPEPGARPGGAFKG